MKLAASAALLAACVVAALHPLVAAVGRVLGRFQKGVGAQPFADAVELAVELQALGQRAGESPSVPRNFS